MESHETSATKIGILFTAPGLRDEHSIANVVREQVQILRDSGFAPVLIVSEAFEWPLAPDFVEIRKVLPEFRKFAYKSRLKLLPEHEEVAAQTARMLRAHAADLRVILAHDLLLKGRLLPYAEGIRAVCYELGQMRVRWLHWVHSLPSGALLDFRRLHPYARLVYPNEAEADTCAKGFGASADEVLVVPNTRDPRSFLVATDFGRALATECQLMDADVVQTLPLDPARALGKGLHRVIAIFGELKRLGSDVRLIVAEGNMWSENARAQAARYLEFGSRAGLSARELHFTSRTDAWRRFGMEPGLNSIPTPVVRDLMTLSNLFIFPSKSESFGLVVVEAALSGQLLVLNSSLPSMVALAGQAAALFFDFGSFDREPPDRHWGTFYRDVALSIREEMASNRVLIAKTRFRRAFNRDATGRALVAAVKTTLRDAPP